MPEQQVEAKDREAAGPVPAAPAFAAPGFGSTGTRSREHAILRLQHAAGNGAVAKLLQGGIQRAPNDPPVMVGPSATPELNGVPVDPNSFTGGILMGKYAPPPPRTVAPRRPQTGRPQDDLSALTGGTDTFGPPIGKSDPAEMTFTQADAEIKALAGWVSKRRQSTPEEAKARERLSALTHRIDVLTIPAKAGKRGQVAKPRTLTGGINWIDLSDDDAAKELDAIVEYVHVRTPSEAEKKKLVEAVDLLEQRVERQLTAQGMDVRRRDLELALTSTKSSPQDQFTDVIATIESIKDDPENLGSGLLKKNGVSIILSAEEVAELKRAGRRMVSAYLRSAEATLESAWKAYTDRIDKAIEHPIVHGLVQFTSGVKKLDYLGEYAGWLTGRKRADEIGRAVMSGSVSSALRQTFEFERFAKDYADDIAKWDEALVSSAGHWAMALTVLKEVLTIVATGGATGLLAFKLAEGIGFVKATLQITGGLTAAGAAGGAGGSAVAQIATKGKVSRSETATATRGGGGAGFTIGVSAIAGPAKEAAKLGSAATRFAGGAAIDTAVTGVGTMGGALISGIGLGDAAVSTAAAPVTSVLGETTKGWAGTSRVKQSIAGAGAGGASNLAVGVASGKDRDELVVDTLRGVGTGGLAPHVARYKPGASVFRRGTNEGGSAGSGVPIKPDGMAATSRGDRPTSLGLGAAGPSGENASPRPTGGSRAVSAANVRAPAVAPALGPGGTPIGVPAGPRQAQGPGGTQIGVPTGPGGYSGEAASSMQKGVASRPRGASGPPSPAASKPASEEGGFWGGLKSPQGSPPGPPLNEVYRISAEDAILIFQMDPKKVVVNDSTRFQRYRWETARWQDGRPTSDPPPIAFRMPNGFIMVDGEQWHNEGRNPLDILKP